MSEPVTHEKTPFRHTPEGAQDYLEGQADTALAIDAEYVRVDARILQVMMEEYQRIREKNTELNRRAQKSYSEGYRDARYRFHKIHRVWYSLTEARALAYYRKRLRTALWDTSFRKKRLRKVVEEVVTLMADGGALCAERAAMLMDHPELADLTFPAFPKEGLDD